MVNRGQEEDEEEEDLETKMFFKSAENFSDGWVWKVNMLPFGRKSWQLSYGCENPFEIRNFDQILLNILNFFTILRDIVCYGTYYFFDIFLKDVENFCEGRQ